MGEGGGAVGAHVVCAFAPLTECSGGVTSVGKLGQWQDMRADSTSPALQNRFYDPQPWGFGTYIYTQGGQALPTRGLIYATSDLAKPTQRERLSLSPPQQRSLAPIVNGLLTVDVKWLFLPPDFLFVIRVVSFSIQQWQEFGMGLRAMPSNPIESHSI